MAVYSVRIKKLHPDSKLPTYAHESDAGMDLYTHEGFTLAAKDFKTIPLGIAIELPPYLFGLIRPRSGLATQYGITTLSSGIIDPGYRGEIHVGLINLGSTFFTRSKYAKIAQLIILPFTKVYWEEVEELNPSDRGERGHGSTGY
jgi:dUTP pyrophosphatase